MEAPDISHNDRQDSFHASAHSLLGALLNPGEILDIANLCWWDQVLKDIWKTTQRHRRTGLDSFVQGHAARDQIAAYAKGLTFYRGIRAMMSRLLSAFPPPNELNGRFHGMRYGDLFASVLATADLETDAEEFWSMETLLTDPSPLFPNNKWEAVDFLLRVRLLQSILDEGLAECVSLLRSRPVFGNQCDGEFTCSIMEAQDLFTREHICENAFKGCQEKYAQHVMCNPGALCFLLGVETLSPSLAKLLHELMQMEAECAGRVFSMVIHITKSELLGSLALLAMPVSAYHSLFMLLGIKHSPTFPKKMVSISPTAQTRRYSDLCVGLNTDVSSDSTLKYTTAFEARYPVTKEDFRCPVLAMYTQPPPEITKDKNITPCPKVVLQAPSGFTGANYYVQVSLVKDDSSQAVQSLDGILRHRITPGGTVEFKRLKIKATSHKMRCSYFRLRFQLHEERGDAREPLQNVSVTSDPVRVYAHSSQLTHLPLATLHVHRVIPESVSSETREIVVIGAHFDGGSALVRVDGFDCTVTQGSLGWMRVALPADAVLWAHAHLVTLFVSTDLGASYVAVCTIPVCSTHPATQCSLSTLAASRDPSRPFHLPV